MNLSPIVIKLGGAILSDSIALAGLFDVIAEISALQKPVVIVHGGGQHVDKQLAAQGLTSEKFQGQRVTPPEHLPTIVGGLAGFVNKTLVSAAKQAGLPAVGISLGDGDLTYALPKVELQCVAETEAHKPQLLQTLLTSHFLPIISSIAIGDDGQLYNVNADIAACTIAELLNAELIMLSDTPGILDAKGELIPQLSATEIEALIDEGVIHGGMQVKVAAALRAAQTLRRCVSILDWHQPQNLGDWIAGKAVGTQVSV